MIDIYILSDCKIGYIWNADDWRKLREEFRIVGHLMGSLSKCPRQDTYLGLPMSLSCEEITLLKEKGYVRLVQCPSLSSCPTSKLKNKFEKEETEFHELQKQFYIQKKKGEIENSLKIIIAGKRKKKETQIDDNSLISSEIEKIQNISVGSNMSCIPTGDHWITESILEEVEWRFPSTEHEVLKYAVFKDLWEKNYCLTSGAKFGGDFLCYLGDPVKFHASFIIICKKSNAEITSKDFVVYGRIGTYTKKTVVLATKHDHSIIYQSLQWVEHSESLPLKSNKSE